MPGSGRIWWSRCCSRPISVISTHNDGGQLVADPARATHLLKVCTRASGGPGEIEAKLQHVRTGVFLRTRTANYADASSATACVSDALAGVVTGSFELPGLPAKTPPLRRCRSPRSCFRNLRVRTKHWGFSPYSGPGERRAVLFRGFDGNTMQQIFLDPGQGMTENGDRIGPRGGGMPTRFGECAENRGFI